MMDEKILKLVAYVLMSSYRERVLVNLHKYGVLFPTQIAMLSEFRSNHVSKVLRELKDKGIVVCINPEERKGRLYKLTELGESVYMNLDSLKLEVEKT